MMNAGSYSNGLIKNMTRVVVRLRADGRTRTTAGVASLAGLSEAAARQALRCLTDEGLVTRSRYRGGFTWTATVTRATDRVMVAKSTDAAVLRLMLLRRPFGAKAAK